MVHRRVMPPGKKHSKIRGPLSVAPEITQDRQAAEWQTFVMQTNIS